MSAPTDAPATIGRNRVRAAAAAVLATLLLAAAFAAQTSAAKAPRDFFGIFAENPSDKDFRGMGDAGFGTNRVPVNWAAVQPTRNGPYNWSQPDRGVYQSRRHGMRPALVVYGTPEVRAQADR